MEPIAHLTEDGRFQLLVEHLVGTARRAADMAAEFGGSEWGYTAGLWHDLGKFSPGFQRYIRTAADPEAHLEGTKPSRVDHSTAGALFAVERLNLAGRILAYPIAGHHSGLTDYESDTTGRAALSQRLQRAELLDAARGGGIPSRVLEQPTPTERPRCGAEETPMREIYRGSTRRPGTDW